MADQNSQDTSEILNRLLVRIYRGLLQYSVECWPWTDAGESAEKRAVERMAAAQQAEIARIVDLLNERGVAIDFGNFPDNSELHYVSLDYLVAKLVEDEAAIVAEVEASRSQLAHDPDGSRLAAELLAAEKEYLSQLRDLAKRHPVAV